MKWTAEAVSVLGPVAGEPSIGSHLASLLSHISRGITHGSRIATSVEWANRRWPGVKRFSLHMSDSDSLDPILSDNRIGQLPTTHHKQWHSREGLPRVAPARATQKLVLEDRRQRPLGEDSAKKWAVFWLIREMPIGFGLPPNENHPAMPQQPGMQWV